MGLEELLQLAKTAAKPITDCEGRINVVSHFDADGMCAGAIAKTTLEAAGKDFDIRFVKQLEEPILEELKELPGEMFLFTDLGSGQLKNVKKHLSDRKVVIADHHQPEDCEWENLTHLNPHLAGIDGKDEISGAGTTYLLCKSIHPEAEKHLYLALVGATGDVQKHDGSFKGVNVELLKTAIALGQIEERKGLKLFGRNTRPLHKALEYCSEPEIPGISGNESAAVQFLSHIGIPVRKGARWNRLSDLTAEQEKTLVSALVMESGPTMTELIGEVLVLPNGNEIREFATMLNACGRLGRADAGVELCLRQRKDIDDIMKDYRRKIATYISWVKKHESVIKETDNAAYLVAGDHVDEAFIGTLMSILSRSMLSSDISFGFANSDGGVKISARASKKLDGKVNLGESIRLTAEKLGGEGGGHSLAAGGKIPIGTEEQFIEMIDPTLLVKEGA